jgi:hypothetical protein
LGFLDGKQGAIFHFMQAFWFRLVWDIRLEEILEASPAKDTTNTPERGETVLNAKSEVINS